MFDLKIQALIFCFLLASLWLWESKRAYFALLFSRVQRLQHGLLNLSFGLLNKSLVQLTFGSLMLSCFSLTTETNTGLLTYLFHNHNSTLTNNIHFGRLIVAMLLLDAWMYLWHRANHEIPLLWRFHRVHHSDTNMDCTTAVRFHPGEILLSALLHLGIIVLFGIQAHELAIYGLLITISTLIHHSNIGLGKFDRPLAHLFITPNLHKVHHSHIIEHTNSNYGTVLSMWDRLGRSQIQLNTEKLRRISFGLSEPNNDSHNDIDKNSSNHFWKLITMPFKQ